MTKPEILLSNLQHKPYDQLTPNQRNFLHRVDAGVSAADAWIGVTQEQINSLDAKLSWQVLLARVGNLYDWIAFGS